MPSQTTPRPRRETRSGLRSILDRRRTQQTMAAFDKTSVHAAAGIAFMYLILAVTLGFKWGIIAALGVLAFLWIGRRIVQNTELAVALVSLVVTLLIMVVAAPSLVAAGQIVHPSSLLVAIAAVPGVFLMARHRGNRGVTAVIIHLGCVLTTFLSAFAMEGAGILVVVWALLVLAVRSGFGLWVQVQIARYRSGLRAPHASLIDVYGLRDRLNGDTDYAVHQTEKFRDEHVKRGADAEEATAATLGELPSSWSVLTSRKVPGSRADIDALAIGAAGLWTVDAKDWVGKITSKRLSDPDTGEIVREYQLNGSSETLVDRVMPSVFETHAVQKALRVNPEVVGTVVCFSDRITMPQDVIALQLYDAHDPETGEVWNPLVYLVRRSALVEFLTEQRQVTWRLPTKREQTRAHREQVSDEELQQRINQRTALDVATMADFALPPTT